AFPDQLKTLKPWQPKRVLQNGGGGLQIRVDGKDPVTGQTFAEIAGRSRAMHKTQGFGNFGGRGGAGPRSESFTLLDGEPASEDIMDGVDTSWARVGAAEIGRMTDEVLEAFDPENPSASVPALLAIHKRLAELPRDPIIDEKRAQLAGIIQACAGLSIETTVPEAEVVPGETLKLRHAAKVRSDVLVRWVAVRYPSVGKELRHVLALEPGREVVRESTQVLPANTKLTQPYWLREDSTVGMFTVNDVSLIGRAENPPVFPVEYEFEIGGERIVLTGEPVQPGSDDAAARRLDVIAPISLNFISDVKVFAPGASKAVEVEILAARPDMNGTVRLEAPAGWKVSPESQPFKLERKGERARVAFTVTAPGAPAEARITARARVNDVWYDNQRVEIRYDHIPLQVLQPPARVKAVSLELATRGREVGYVPGAGDDTVAALKEMGYSVRTLSGEDLTPETLKGLDAVVIGIRAFNTRDDLDGKTAVLSEYVQGGGTVVAQYNNARGLSGIRLGPFEFRLSNNQRVTDEHAPVRFLAADHPALNTPNKITAADFENWVQERGLYFPSGWDEAFTPLLECADPGEEPLKGGLLVAQHGKGCFVYTSLAFFRQLPEGVPGAYRLFANLVSLGK
ncbi:MAG TPA: LmbE family protein, partial [Verrucomicrobiota bacterium]|nr:LmbE family protein [Verrucomicrobiota bacterium]